MVVSEYSKDKQLRCAEFFEPTLPVMTTFTQGDSSGHKDAQRGCKDLLEIFDVGLSQIVTGAHSSWLCGKRDVHDEFRLSNKEGNHTMFCRCAQTGD